MVTTVALKVDVHRRLRVASIETGIVMTQIVREAVDLWLKRYESRRRSGKR